MCAGLCSSFTTTFNWDVIFSIFNEIKFPSSFNIFFFVLADNLINIEMFISLEFCSKQKMYAARK